MNGIAVIVLAAGLSRRFEPGRKLAFPVLGRPLLEHALAAAAAAGLSRLVVVTAPEDGASQALARTHGAEVVLNPEPERGLGRSIASGAAVLTPDTRAAFVALGDMPCIAPATYRALASACSAGTDIVVPVHDTCWGHPVLFGAAHFPALAALDGDRGARPVIENAGPRLMTLDVDDPGILLDVDMQADVDLAVRLLAHRARAGGARDVH